MTVGKRRIAGQSSVLAALLCGMLIVVVAMTTNVGELVTERIAMQNAIDMGAYAGAATQASYLNYMRYYNDQIWQEAYNLRDDFMKSTKCPGGTNAPDPNCVAEFYDAADNGPGICQIAMGIGNRPAPQAETKFQQVQTTIDNSWHTKLDAANKLGFQQAPKNARATADANFPGIGANGIFDFRMRADGKSEMVDVDVAEVDVSYVSWCIGNFITQPIFVEKTVVTKDQLQAWDFKYEDGDVLFAAKAEHAHPTNHLMDLPNPYFMQPGDRCYDGQQQKNGRCALNVYAAASPYYGKLGSRGNEGGKSNRWNNGMANQVDDKDLLNTDRPGSVNCDNGSGYCPYRVRFIGLYNSSLDYIGGKTQASVAFVPPTFAKYMRH